MMKRAILLLLMVFVVPTMSHAVGFEGASRVEISDPTGGLSTTGDAMTVACWFKLSVPSGVALTDNMTILFNRKDGNETTSYYAYLIRYNYVNGAIEFVCRGLAGTKTVTLIDRPMVDRWYHVAVNRSADLFEGFVDGQEIAPIPFTSVGNTFNTNGVNIGGSGNARYLRGEVQEVAIYSVKLTQNIIQYYMFRDIPTNLAGLRGYYKLGYTTDAAEYYMNAVQSPPPGTLYGVKQGTGTNVFEETDTAGEQSLFDSQKNGGRNSITPLSGSFTWQDSLFSRPTPGIPLDLSITYSSSDRDDSPLGPGWHHSFDAAIAKKSSTEFQITMPDRSVEIWDKSNTTYSTRHLEYRGDLSRPTYAEFKWITPNRLVYLFNDPEDGTLTQGCLGEIQDYNGNAIHIVREADKGRITNVIDTANGSYAFSYNAQGNISAISFNGWIASFSYSNIVGMNRLVAEWITGPPAYSNVTTRWLFEYNTAGLLSKVRNPLSNVAVTVYYDMHGRKSNQVDALGYSSVTEYAKPGRRDITHTDADGFKWIESYNRKHRLLSSKDPLGNTVSYTYDGAGNRISQTDARGYTTRWSYDNRANMTCETNAVGEIRRSIYHSFFNKPIEDINPLGWSTYTTYDAAGNLVTNRDNLGILAVYSYYSNGLVRTAMDGNGNVSRFTYTAEGFLASRADPATNTTSFAYNDLGWQTSVTNPLNQITAYGYDVNGNVIFIKDALSRTFSAVYDANGNLVRKTDGKSQWTYLFYDSKSQLTQNIDRAAARSTMTYSRRGSVLTAKDALGNTISNAYDSANRLVRMFDPLTNSSAVEYDANGNKIATVDNLGKRWLTTYDELNRSVAESDPQGNTKTVAYDPGGRVKTITTPMGYVSTHWYDGRGRLTNWIDAEGYVWLYDYDGAGNITNITDALGGHYIMSYGSRNERRMEKNQDEFEWLYSYDELMRPKTQRDPNGTLRTVAYDAAGRISYVSLSTGRMDAHSYDNNDKLTALTRTGSGIPTMSQFQYDSMDRITKYTDAFSRDVGYTYDAIGRIVNTIYPDGKMVSNAYDQLSRLTSQTDWAGRRTTYAYDKANRLIRRLYPNGITQTNGFDDSGRLTSLSVAKATNVFVVAYQYAYDKNGNKTKSNEKGTLTWPLPKRIDESSEFTPSGRITNRTDALDVSNTWIYVFDASGNMTNASSLAQSFGLTYDEDNRVTILDWKTGLSDKHIVNRYDALGRRVSKIVDGTETRFVLDDAGSMERILCDTDDGGNIRAYYVHGPDLVYKVDAAGNLACYHSDAMANIVAITDAASNTIAQYAYTPYGCLLGFSFSTNNQERITNNEYTFVGSQGVMQELPHLYFMRARYYSAEAAVLLSTDPVKHIGPAWKPIMHTYANDNPISYKDPAGLWAYGDHTYTQLDDTCPATDLRCNPKHFGLTKDVEAEIESAISHGDISAFYDDMHGLEDSYIHPQNNIIANIAINTHMPSLLRIVAGALTLFGIGAHGPGLNETKEQYPVEYEAKQKAVSKYETRWNTSAPRHASSESTLSGGNGQSTFTYVLSGKSYTGYQDSQGNGYCGTPPSAMSQNAPGAGNVANAYNSYQSMTPAGPSYGGGGGSSSGSSGSSSSGSSGSGGSGGSSSLCGGGSTGSGGGGSSGGGGFGGTSGGSGTIGGGVAGSNGIEDKLFIVVLPILALWTGASVIRRHVRVH